MAKKKALVLGGLGVIGRNLINHLATLDDWEIAAVSRRAPDDEIGAKARFISCDMLDMAETERKLGGLKDITHIFCCALHGGIDATTTEQNRRLVAHPVEVVSNVSKSLDRVVLQEGSKAYGRQLGPFKTPAKESDSRHMPPNFYYDQEDFLIEFQNGKGWTWAVLRPEAVCGFAMGNPMNLILCFGVYAAICRELGWGFDFPGKAGAFDALCQVTDAAHLARGLEWAATSEAAADRAFNLTNGDFFRWRHIWPVLGRVFELGYRGVRTMKLADVMADKGAVWDAIVKKHGLVPNDFARLVAWKLADHVFGCDWDVMSATTRIRQAGLTDVVDSEEMFRRQFAEFRAKKILP